MKLLFDQNISPKIVKQVESEFPDSTQVRFIGLEDSADSVIFEYAKRNEYAIVTFDSDFADLHLLRGHPPKIIWLRTGNLTTRAVYQIVESMQATIQNFLQNEHGGILEVWGES